MTLPDVLDKLVGRLDSGDSALASATVLVPMSLLQTNLTLTFVEKTHWLRRHAGQIAFPGGRVDPGDSSVEDAALREAREEVGLRRDEVEILGRLPIAMVAATGVSVAPVVGWWRHRPLAPVDRGEIAAVHDIELRTLANPETRVLAVHPSGYRGPAFVVEDLFIWGMTGRLLDVLIEAGGWEHPWDRSRTRAIPDRFL